MRTLPCVVLATLLVTASAMAAEKTPSGLGTVAVPVPAEVPTYRAVRYTALVPKGSGFKKGIVGFEFRARAVEVGPALDSAGAEKVARKWLTESVGEVAAKAFSVERVEATVYFGEEKNPRKGHWEVFLAPTVDDVPIDLTTVVHVEGSRVLSAHLEGVRVVGTLDGKGPVITAVDAIARVDAVVAKFGKRYTINHIRLVYAFDARAHTEKAATEGTTVNTMSLNWEIGASGELLYVHADTGAVWRND